MNAEVELEFSESDSQMEEEKQKMKKVRQNVQDNLNKKFEFLEKQKLEGMVQLD